MNGLFDTILVVEESTIDFVDHVLSLHTNRISGTAFSDDGFGKNVDEGMGKGLSRLHA